MTVHNWLPVDANPGGWPTGRAGQFLHLADHWQGGDRHVNEDVAGLDRLKVPAISRSRAPGARRGAQCYRPKQTSD